MTKPRDHTKSDSNIGKEFFLVEEVAEKLRVSNMTIYRYIKLGKLKACKIGKEFRIEVKEFTNFIDKTRSV